MKILFVGGGTLGSVIPLIAIAEKLKANNPQIDFYWLGTKWGPEKAVVENYNIQFKAIYAGKLRRYFSLVNFLDIFKVFIGLCQAIIILFKWRPGAIVSAGGYVAVPVVWAGWLLGIPSLIHQQDVRLGLANKLSAPAAKKITVCFAESANYFKNNKVEVVGNPIRESFKQLADRKLDYKKWGLKENLPTLLVMGGGRGSRSVNELVWSALPKLLKFCQLVHITGKDKPPAGFKDYENYHRIEFLIDSTEIFGLADLLISRAGMASLTEIAYLAKPAIIIPIFNSHQEENAKYFYEGGGAELLNQAELDENKLIEIIWRLLKDKKISHELGSRAHQLIKWGAEERMAGIILGIAKINA